MTVLEILILIPTIFYLYKGWKRGIIFEAATILGIIFGCYAAVHFSHWVAQLIHIEGNGTMLAAFAITFAAVIVLSSFLGKCVEGFVKIVKLNGLNKFLGAALGALKCLCVLGILLNFILMIDFNERLITPETKEKSALFEPTRKLGAHLTDKLHQYSEEARAKQAQNKD